MTLATYSSTEKPPYRPTEEIIRDTVRAAGKGLCKTYFAAQLFQDIGRISYPYNEAHRLGLGNVPIRERDGFLAVTEGGVGLLLGFSAMQDAFTVAENTAVLGHRALQSNKWLRYCSVAAGSVLTAAVAFRIIQNHSF